MPLWICAGNVLRQARGRLEAFWTATCAAEGSFAWQAAQSFSVALMKTMQVGSTALLYLFLVWQCAEAGAAAAVAVAGWLAVAARCCPKRSAAAAL